MLLDRREGRNRLVRANREHPLWAEMSALIAATYSPVPVLREAVPGDLDVLVVGDTPRRMLADIAAEAGARLRIAVNITRVAPEDWGASASPLLRQVRARPHVDVMTGEVHA